MSAPAIRTSRSVIDSPLMRPHRGWSGKLRWHLNARLTRRLRLLDAVGARLTLIDAYGAPGDTLLTAIVCRNLHRRYPRLRLNLVTPNAELVKHDPAIHTLNEREGFFSVWSWYPELAGRRDGQTNVLRETFERLGWGSASYDYRARVYLAPEEKLKGRALLGATKRPIVAFNTRSKEVVKNWPVDAWREALAALRERYELVHLGESSEPVMDGTQRFAGRLSMRESMSVLSHAHVHVGPDSFLMHAANGLDVPAVIIFGGSRTPANLGYSENINLFTELPCSSCWLHSSCGEVCPHDLLCMQRIVPAEVVAAVERLIAPI